MHHQATLAVGAVLAAALAVPAAGAEPAVPKFDGGTSVATDVRGSVPPACVPRPAPCAQCDRASASPIKVGETFADTRSAVAATNQRLEDDHASGIARELHVGSVTVSLLLMESNGMGGLVVLRQDPGRVCVIGTWAWDFGGNGVSVDIAAIAQVPMRNGVLVIVKAIGTSHHGTEASSYEPGVRLLSASLITAEKVDEVLGEIVDENADHSYDEWPEPVGIEIVDSSLRILYGRRAWVLAPGASKFVRLKQKRMRR